MLGRRGKETGVSTVSSMVAVILLHYIYDFLVYICCSFNADTLGLSQINICQPFNFEVSVWDTSNIFSPSARAAR